MNHGNKNDDGRPLGHFDGQRFFNPGHPAPDRSLRQVLRWKLNGEKSRWPDFVPVCQTRPQERCEQIRVTMVGHATVLVQAAGVNILTDPVWSDRVSPIPLVGPRRITRPGIEFSDLPAIDLVLVSHNHYDHLDLRTLKRLCKVHDPLIVTPLGNDAIVRRAIPKARITTGDWGSRTPFRDGVEVHIVPANHWSARGLGDRYRVLWGGFMVHTPAGKVYFAGDTGYGDGRIFREMREAYGAPDVAVLPIGAYAPRWFMAGQHIDPSEAVRIMLDLEARHGLGIHWGDFQLTDEAREEPPQLLRSALDNHGIPLDRFPALSAGDVFDLKL